MIVLTETTDKIQVVLSGAVTTNQLQCFSSCRNISTSIYTPMRTVIDTNNTTPVDVVGAPSASTQCVVDFIKVYNKDTVGSTVTVLFNANGTTYNLYKTILAADESLEYVQGNGFKVLTANGEIKLTVNQGDIVNAGGASKVVLGTDRSTTSSTIGDVTGLSFSVTAGKEYFFRFVIHWTASATATGGTRWSINGPASPTTLRYRSEYALTSTTNTYNNAVAYDIPAGLSATSADTAGNIAVIDGFIRPSANGTVIARFASEGATITAKTGSVVFYHEV